MDTVTTKDRRFEVLILVDSGIGNAIQTLYSVEYLLKQAVSVGIFLGGINQAFQQYLKTCYREVIIDSLEDVHTNVLIHGFTYQETEMPTYEKYIYISADYHSTRHRTETEQFLDVVKALYPSSYSSSSLTKLKENYSERVAKLNLSNKAVFYPGCNPIVPSKRWPYFPELMRKIGIENVIIVGGKEDLDFSYSYFYPKWITQLFHQKFLNNRKFWNSCKKAGLLRKHAQWDGLAKLENAYFNEFEWGELVSVFKRSKSFVGNDGGLSHLAAAAGAKGLMIFGPTSIQKNMPFSSSMDVIKSACCCSQFGAEGKTHLTKSYINCPCQIKCLYNLTVEKILTNQNSKIY